MMAKRDSSSVPDDPRPRAPKVSRQSQKLSEERLARKRELDRQAQRSARVKTKNHIAHLESRIEALTRVQGTGDVKCLIDQIEQQRKENEVLRATLNTIGKLIGSTDEPVIETTAVEREKAPTPRDSPDTDNTLVERLDDTNDDRLDVGGLSNPSDPVVSNNEGVMDFGQSDICSQNWVPDGMTLDGQVFGSRPAIGKTRDYTFCIPTARALLNTSSFLPQPWQATTAPCCCKIVLMSNELLRQCSRLRLQNTLNQKARDADIAIRAVLHGWNAVTEKYALDPVWATLRQADEALFCKCFSSTERLVCLRIVNLKLRYQVNPTEQNLEAVPYYLRERPSQRVIEHTPLIDYLAWPGLRERLVFNPHCYCSEKFSSLFWLCFRFIWEYEFRDAYVRNDHSGLYQFSAPFLECTQELHHFQMDPRFLDEFPELKEDILSTKERLEPNFFHTESGAGRFNMNTPQQQMLPAVFLDGMSNFPQSSWSTRQVSS